MVTTSPNSRIPLNVLVYAEDGSYALTDDSFVTAVEDQFGEEYGTELPSIQRFCINFLRRLD